MAGFAYLAYSANEQHHKMKCLSILLWPFIPALFKIALGRTIWNIVDVITAIGLLISAFTDDKKIKT
jgi:hypothetical protein